MTHCNGRVNGLLAGIMEMVSQTWAGGDVSQTGAGGDVSRTGARGGVRQTGVEVMCREKEKERTLDWSGRCYMPDCI